MKKILNKGVKPLAYVFLACQIIVFVCCLTFMSEYYYLSVKSNKELMAIFNRLQNVNDLLLYTGLVGVISFAVICISGAIYRKKFYKSNLICNSIVCGVSGILSIVTLVMLVSIIPAFSANFDLIVETTLTWSYGDLTPTATPIICTILALLLSISFTIFYEVFTILKYRDSKKDAKVVVE